MADVVVAQGGGNGNGSRALPLIAVLVAAVSVAFSFFNPRAMADREKIERIENKVTTHEANLHSLHGLSEIVARRDQVESVVKLIDEMKADLRRELTEIKADIKQLEEINRKLDSIEERTRDRVKNELGR